MLLRLQVFFVSLYSRLLNLSLLSTQINLRLPQTQLSVNLINSGYRLTTSS